MHGHVTLNKLKQEKSCNRGITVKRKNCEWNDGYLLKALKTLDIKREFVFRKVCNDTLMSYKWYNLNERITFYLVSFLP